MTSVISERGRAVDHLGRAWYHLVLPRGAVAQLGARVNGIHEVTGSIPVSSTKPNKIAPYGRTETR
jgi:hypothetical protein